MNNLAGVWQGWGASYEVRFRYSNIMSVAVKHATLFTIGVNEKGAINGGGVIVYDLDPNLCGLANLVKYTNAGINILAKLPDFYQLSGTIMKAFSLTGEGSALAEEAAAKSAAQEASSEAEKELGEKFKEEANEFVKDAFADTLKDKFKEYGAEMVEKMIADDKEEGAEKKSAGCTSEGPGTLSGAAAQVGKSAAGSLPTGAGGVPMGVPMVPGVTQVQYHYKGLEHGPEQRLYNIVGSVGMWNGETRMVMQQSGPVFNGSKDLMVEYMVNYKTDKQSFPTWSPFTKKPGVIWISNGPKTPKPPQAVVQLAQQMGANLSATNGSVFAYLEDTGTHRDGAVPWQEYEYVWFVQKLDDQKAIQNFVK